MNDDRVVSVFDPSVAENVNSKLPASFTFVLGVIVNALLTWDTVAVEPNEPEVTSYDHVRVTPSGAVETSVTTVGVPSVDNA